MLNEEDRLDSHEEPPPPHHAEPAQGTLGSEAERGAAALQVHDHGDSYTQPPKPALEKVTFSNAGKSYRWLLVPRCPCIRTKHRCFKAVRTFFDFFDDEHA